MLNLTTKIYAGTADVTDAVEDFCKDHFGIGGVQKGRRWFYRIITPVTIKVFIDGSFTKHHRIPVDNSSLYTMVYFRNEADALWFTLNFKGFK